MKRNHAWGYNPKLKPLAETGELYCENCRGKLEWVWVNTSDAILCIFCFDMLHPREAAVNRFKKPGEQLEMPL